MGKSVGGEKADNITIRCSVELKERAKRLHASRYSEIPFNSFLGQMIVWGLEAEEERIKKMDSLLGPPSKRNAG